MVVIKHGHTTRTRQSHTYVCWAMMKQRCLNPKATGFKYYGGRGIKITPRWMRFRLFLLDMGEAPSLQHSLDRRNLNGNYDRENARWVKKEEQAMNRRNWRKRI